MTLLQKDSLAGALSTLKYKKDQTIVTEGEPGSSYYIIKNVELKYENIKLISNIPCPTNYNGVESVLSPIFSNDTI